MKLIIVIFYHFLIFISHLVEISRQDECLQDTIDNCRLSGPYLCQNISNSQQQVCVCQPGYYQNMSSQSCLTSENLLYMKVKLEQLTFNDDLNNPYSDDYLTYSGKIESTLSSLITYCNLSSTYTTSSVLAFKNDSNAVLGDLVLYFNNNQTQLALLNQCLTKYVYYCSNNCFGLHTTATLTQEAELSNLCELNFTCPGNTKCLYIEEEDLYGCSCEKGFEGAGYLYVDVFTVKSCKATPYCNNVDKINPCGDNITCIDITGSFYCECPYDKMFNGTTCVQCPCENGGHCVSGVTNSGYQCDCPFTYTGENCESNLPLILIIVSAVIVFLIIVIIAVGVYLYMQLRKRQRNSETQSLINADEHDVEDNRTVQRLQPQAELPVISESDPSRRQGRTLYETLPYLLTLPQLKLPRAELASVSSELSANVI